MAYRKDIPKIQLYEDIFGGLPQPKDILGLDKGLSQILGDAAGYEKGKIYDRRYKNIVRPLGEAAEVLYSGIGAALDAPYKTIKGPLKYLFGENPVIQETQERTPEGIDLAKIPGSGVGRPDFVPNDLPVETDITKPGVKFQGLAPLIKGKDAPPSAEDDYELGTGFQSVAEQLKKLEDKRIKQLYGGQEGRLSKETLESKGEATGEEPKETPADSFDTLFKASMSSYQASQGVEDTGEKTLEDYKQEFEKATGISASGKVDKSNALMALGLALMQNKAGKGFNVGKMLSAVGEAGEAALPALEKAKQEAKLGAAKAGEYALGKVGEDEAEAKLKAEEMRDRTNYYVIPKGKEGGPLGVVDAIMKGKGEFKPLNKYQLAHLHEDEDFMSKFDIVNASDYLDIAKEAMETPEAKAIYSKTNKFIPLFSGADKDLGFYVQLPDANAAKAGTNPAFVDNADSVLGQIQSMEQDLSRQEKDFKEIAGLLQVTDVGGVSQLTQGVIQGFRNFGFKVGGDTTPITQIKNLLTKLKAENAADILGESGKTLSDNDRKMVAQIVGGISLTEGDEDELVRKLGRLYETIINKGRQNVSESYGRLQKAGVNINRSSVQANPTGQFVKGDDGIYDMVS